MGKIIFLCVGTVVCKDFEKFKSSRVWECGLCVVKFKDFENSKVPRVWVCKPPVVVCKHFEMFHFPGLGALRCGVNTLKTSKLFVCGPILY